MTDESRCTEHWGPDKVCDLPGGHDGKHSVTWGDGHGGSTTVTWTIEFGEPKEAPMMPGRYLYPFPLPSAEVAG